MLNNITLKVSEIPLHRGFQSNPSEDFDAEIEGLAKMYCDRNYEGEPLTMDTLYDCFEKAFKAGTQYLGKAEEFLKIGELHVHEGKVLFNLNDKVEEAIVEVEEVGSITKNNFECQEITTYYIFNNEDKTCLSNREIYVIRKDLGRLKIPAGRYNFNDYLITRAIYDQNF